MNFQRVKGIHPGDFGPENRNEKAGEKEKTICIKRSCKKV